MDDVTIDNVDTILLKEWFVIGNINIIIWDNESPAPWAAKGNDND
jgi:hypothetical protein